MQASVAAGQVLAVLGGEDAHASNIKRNARYILDKVPWFYVAMEAVLTLPSVGLVSRRWQLGGVGRGLECDVDRVAVTDRAAFFPVRCGLGPLERDVARCSITIVVGERVFEGLAVFDL